MVLYHAISAYQILTVLVHKLSYHENEPGIIILPDFIIEKYPNYDKILRVFNEVYLFSYTSIEHNEEKVLLKTQEIYNCQIPYKITDFQDIYIAGAHFYFSLIPISEGVKFCVFEDASGMYKQSERLYQNLKQNFSVHAKIMNENGMFTLENPLIDTIFCNKELNDIRFSRKIKHWDTMKSYFKLSYKDRNRIISFFVDIARYYDVEDAIIIVTQNFAGNENISIDQQEKIYIKLKDKIAHKEKIILKKHPDDNFDYNKIFNNALIIQEKIPLELLVTFFVGNPKMVIIFSSSTDLSWTNYRIINLSKKFSRIYDYKNEFESILLCLDLWREFYES